jgi:circadian clock protein KaiB
MTAPAPTDPRAAVDRCYDLTLFVNGASELSARAIADARRLCDLSGGRCRLAVIDIHDDPAAAVRSRIYAVPALVRTGPLPVRRLVGDLSQTGRVLSALRLLRAGELEETPA